MSTKMRTSKALLKDLKELSDKHDYPITMIGRAAISSDSDTGCPSGTKPYDITEQDASGRWVTTTICLPVSNRAGALFKLISKK
jgi:hypothetical protein